MRNTLVLLLLLLFCGSQSPAEAKPQSGYAPGRGGDITYARILFYERKYDKAIRLFEEVYRTAKNKDVKVSALEWIANSYKRLGNHEAALQVYQRVLQEFGTYKERSVRGNMADLYLKLGRYDEAIAEYSSFMPRNMEYYRLVGDVYYKSGNVKQAINTWYAWLGENSRSVAAYRSISNILYSHGLIKEAIDVLLLARKKNRNDTLFYTELAELYVFAMEYDKAVGEYLEVLLAKPSKLDAITKAIMKLITGKDEDIVVLVREQVAACLQQNPKQDAVRLLLADIYLKCEMVAEATREYDKVNDLRNDKDQIYFKLGDKLMELKYFQEAVAIFSKINPSGQRRFEMQKRLAAAFFHLAEYGRALEVVDQVVAQYARSKDMPELYLLRAKLLNALQKTGLALQVVKDIKADFRGSEWDFQARLIEADIQIKADNLPRALEIYRELAAQKVGGVLQSEVVYRYAGALFAAGRFQRSYDTYNLIVTQYQHSVYVNNALREVLFIKAHLANEAQVLKPYAAAALLYLQGRAALGAAAYSKLLGGASSADDAAYALTVLIRMKAEKAGAAALISQIEGFLGRFPDYTGNDSFRMAKADSLEHGLNQPRAALEVYYSIVRDYPGSVLLSRVRPHIRRLDAAGR